MPYSPIPYEHISHPVLREVFEHTNAFLRDIYTYYAVQPPDGSGGGQGNFTIALVLLCIIDGLSRDVYPTRFAKRDQEKRFKQLIREKLCWGRPSDSWVDKGKAARVLYGELRNNLAHELAQDRRASDRSANFSEPEIGKWAMVPPMPADELDGRPRWEPSWPILRIKQTETGRRCYQLCDAALYWAVKKMARDMALDSKLLREAERLRDAEQRRSRLSSFLRRFCKYSARE